MLAVREFPESPSFTVEGGLALKEWAVALRALDQGKQIILLRKGGIVEETKEFRVAGTSFFFYPTYEHQKKELIKPEWHEALEETIRGVSMPVREVTVTHAAQVVEDIELLDENKLRQLDHLHIWAPHYAAERLHWKPKKPLHVLAVRVYRLEEPRTIPVRDAYLGCTSWVRLQDAVDSRGKPVLSDETFQRHIAELHAALGLERPFKSGAEL
ncbi:MAG: DUF1802 family protein [Alicyclobacillaceae bacterium]|nr:DUF1802 family protein [Alicyclobacillaceae bacterium]